MSAHPKHMFRSQFRPKAVLIGETMSISFSPCVVEVQVTEMMAAYPKVVLDAVMKELGKEMQDLGPIVLDALKAHYASKEKGNG